MMKQQRTGETWFRAVAFAALALFAFAFSSRDASAQAVCPPTSDIDIIFDDADNYCELCGVGQITARVAYADDDNAPITNIRISQDLSLPALVPVPGTTTVRVSRGVAPPAPVPTNAGGVWTWDFGSYQLVPDGNTTAGGQFIEITYRVRRANGVSEEGLYNASKAINASVAYNAVGSATACPVQNDFSTLTFRRPDPQVIKQGRNYDAGQSSDQYDDDPVFGHNNDDIIWRIQIDNDGLAALQDVRLDDLMEAGNLDINYACPSEAAANAVAANNGVAPGGSSCIAASNTLANFRVADPFGVDNVVTDFDDGDATNGFTRNLNGRDIDVAANDTGAVLYLVGKATSNASCDGGGRTNTVSNVGFGCEADGPTAGGIPIANETAEFRTRRGDTGNFQLTVDDDFTGVTTMGTAVPSTQPMGARGLVTLTIRNNTGGTLKDIVLTDFLPDEYVIDPTYWTGGNTKTLQLNGTTTGVNAIRPAFGVAYGGMIDRITWENPQPNLTPPSQTPLQNIAPRFRLHSSTANPHYPDQVHLLRQGDVVVVTFPVVLISQNRGVFEPYDLRTDLDSNRDTRPEPDPEVPNTDNQVRIDYNTFCSGDTDRRTEEAEDIDPSPEDLDVFITDINNREDWQAFILTNDPTQELPIRVRVANSGGHSAQDYHLFVSFGATMQVVAWPGTCSVYALSNTPPQPNPWKVWVQPNPIPATATVYHCTQPASIGPGATQNFDFRVIKTSDPGRIALDDLSLRADVVGEITLYDDSLLWFPTPILRPDGQLDRTNNYSLDGKRQRVIGFNLIKTFEACNENDETSVPGPNTKRSPRVEIGEECRYTVRTGGWFGFKTPGFTLIQVDTVTVTDPLPSGQGYVSSTDPDPTSSEQIVNFQYAYDTQPASSTRPVGLFAPGRPFIWTFNNGAPINRLDEWFEAEIKTRVLNHPVNTVAAPNQHAARSTNVLVSTFRAVFESGGTRWEPILNDEYVGYPNVPIRREDLTITEPRLTVVKEVCNETRYGVGPACSNWTTLADDGDAYNDYIYRLTVTNEAAASGIARAPAYDLVVTDTLDPSGLACVMPFDGDALDNDADGSEGSGDSNGEGTITNNCTMPATPGSAIVTFSHTHSTALRRINPGQQVTLYYRVDFNDDAAPLQTFTNSYRVSYDSLEGSTNESGNQSLDRRPNGDIGGARVHTSAPAVARVRMIAVQTQPKRITRTANPQPTAPPPPAPQHVVVGEEVAFELTTLLPVARLANFVIRDELPPGLRCSEAPVINLDAPPYAAAGFQPGGTFNPTCTDSVVEWNFGTQRITRGTTPDNRYPFNVNFITRVENSALTNEGGVISNGTPATSVTARYVNEAGTLVELTFGQVDMLVREPRIALTKSFAPIVNADAADELQVTVTATNNGTSPAYNLRVMDDLTAGLLTYVGNIGGTTPPTADTAVLGADRPVFSWPAGYAIAAGANVTFTFVVRVAPTVQPHKVLANTVYASWTSLPGRNTALNAGGQIGVDGAIDGMRNGALPNAGDTINDYEARASASVTVAPLTVTKANLNAALSEIGTHKPFQIVITLPEGVTENLSLADNLNFGGTSYVLANNATFDVTYEFVGIDSINGQQPAEAAFTAVPADGANNVATWTIGRVVTTSENDRATSAITPTIRINYFARINNDLVTDAGDVLRNSVDVTYRNGETGAPQTINYVAAQTDVHEPVLTATKELSNVTTGKNPTDPLALGDIVQYVVTITNGGRATAYDLNIVDTLPIELALRGDYTPTAAINNVPVVGFVGVPAGAPNGPLVWGRANGDLSLDLPAGALLALTYRVVVLAPPTDATGIANRVYTDWTSLQGANTYERTGAGCPTITPPNDYCFGPAIAIGNGTPAPPPQALAKSNTQATASVGEVFRYRVRVPSVPYPYALYDVRITDDLTASAADMRFISVTKIAGTQPWTPQNTGTATNLTIEDPTADVGIDIPANEQIEIEIAVQLLDTPTNVTGLTFTNTANYFFNRINNISASQRPGLPGTTAAMTIVGPDTLTVQKSGPPRMTLGQPGAFVVNVHNTGTGRAWELSLTDRLPNTATSGMCEIAPNGFTAQMYRADGTTVVGPALVLGTDFSATFMPAPQCELYIKMLTPAAAIEPNNRLIVGYNAYLDNDSERNAALTNIVGATEWFSADRSNPTYAEEVRAYTRVLTDGTPTVLDHQDAYTVTADLPVLRFEKTVINVTTGQDPGRLATPGDVLRYRIRIENLVADPVPAFTLRDELGRLNTVGSYTPGTLQLITVPAGADVSNTNPSGGANNSGVVDVRNLTLGGLNSFIVIEYEVRLAPVLANNSYVANQAQVLLNNTEVARSDDPTINAAPDPLVLGDEDPTRVQITSAPKFRVQKTSRFLGASPAVLLAGESLRYTITVKNIGTDNAVDVAIRDQIPANTRYVPGSTTINGTELPDVGGTSPLVNGIAVYAPEDATAGRMRADATSTTSNVATITFDVTTYPDLLDGTVISNQAFVSAVSVGIVDYPSDDPRTPIVNDPTRDVIGNAPLLFADKRVVLAVDMGSPGVVDPGDTLRYTITIYNTGAIPATDVRLVDNVPPFTTYVANSTLLNNLPVGQPDGGSSPLAAGVYVSSADRTPPLPTAGEGTLSPNSQAVVQFDLRVNDDTPTGTIIRNQASVRTAELPTVLTDGDGNPSTGPEPTVVVVGNTQQLSITKEVAVVGGGPASPGATLEYVVRVTNISLLPAQYVVIRDDLDMNTPGYLTLVENSATLNAQTTGLTVAGAIITADYSTSYGALQPRQSVVLRFRAVINPSLLDGTRITNTGTVTWNNPPRTASASISLDVGGMPGIGVLNGKAWHDANFNRTLEADERVLEGWTVELYRNDRALRTVQTDMNGVYRIGGIAPNYASGDRYEVRFTAPGAGSNTAKLGRAYSAFSNDLQRIYDIIVDYGSNLQDLNLPIAPNGVAYNSVARTPVANVTLTLLSGVTRATLPANCFDDPAQQNQVTLVDGYYRFDLNFSDPACPSGSNYILDVTPPPSGYIGTYSQIIPPTTSTGTNPFGVATCPGSVDDAVAATGEHCEVQVSEFAPPLTERARSAGTKYHANLAVDNSRVPGTSQLFNNHVPVDPDLQGALAISKTTPLLNVVRGQLVPYVITYKNVTEVPLFDVSIVDRIPAGFRYVEGSARIDNIPVEPILAGRELTWNDLSVDRSATHTLLVLLAVGAGVSEGEFVNRVQAVHMLTGRALSNEASATVRVVPDPTFDCTDITGKVFDDANRNGHQDAGEEGIAGVRLVTARGLTATTDAYGRYHITCAAIPREGRGSNFVLKLDDRTLPSGYRASTNEVNVQRATRGKALKFNFGASIHRVVGLDLADAVFEPGTTEIREQWKPRLQLLINELQKAPAVLRLSYLADVEDEQLVDRRMNAIKAEITRLGLESRLSYPLTIEPEVFWRLGAPQPTAVRAPESK